MTQSLESDANSDSPGGVYIGGYGDTLTQAVASKIIDAREGLGLV